MNYDNYCYNCEKRCVGCRTECELWAKHEAAKAERYKQTDVNFSSFYTSKMLTKALDEQAKGRHNYIRRK